MAGSVAVRAGFVVVGSLALDDVAPDDFDDEPPHALKAQTTTPATTRKDSRAARDIREFYVRDWWAVVVLQQLKTW